MDTDNAPIFESYTLVGNKKVTRCCNGKTFPFGLQIKYGDSEKYNTANILWGAVCIRRALLKIYYIQGRKGRACCGMY